LIIYPATKRISAGSNEICTFWPTLKGFAVVSAMAPFLLNLKSSYLIRKEGQALRAALTPVLAE